MDDITFEDLEQPIFDKDYCDNKSIRSEWFKFDKTLAGYLYALVDEDTNDKGEWILSDVSFLAYTMYAILCYQLNGYIPQKLEERLNSKSMKLAKLAYNHAVAAIEESRSRIAENRYNGKKGGIARKKNQ